MRSGEKLVLIAELFQCLYGIGLLPFLEGKPRRARPGRAIIAPLMAVT